jgi:hypothetical protein
MLALLWLASCLPQDPLLTVAEASGFTRTSRHAEVVAFVERLHELPSAAHLTVATFGQSHEGRDLLLVTAGLPGDGDGRLRILVNANIHAGEVEGKEATLMLLRELANGEHEDLLAHAALLFVPNYNPDGNDRIDKKNRVDQNGPDDGVGQRPNAQGLDLNRDFVKAESPECRALLGVFRARDPHVFVDLHTTDGSHHGYHLTYSPSLSTNVDPTLDRFARDVLLPEVRSRVEDEHGYRTFHYGNFAGRNPRRWDTYDHRPRFGTNYYGLRNRIGILSEAYSHASFEDRVRATRAFVLECVRTAVRHRTEILALCAAADRRLVEPDDEVRFGWDTVLAEPVEHDVLVGSVERVTLPDGLGTRLVATPEFRAEKMQVRWAFESRQHMPLPDAWAIPAPNDAVKALLATHGIGFERIAEPRTARARAFRIDERREASRPFQGHREVTLRGAWQDAAEHELPAGTLLVPARQRLARLAAQLLEPLSEDSLVTWNVLESYPVLRLEAR